MVKNVKMIANNEDGHIIVQVENGKIMVNKRGFVPTRETWLTEMNPVRVQEYYKFPKGISF